MSNNRVFDHSIDRLPVLWLLYQNIETSYFSRPFISLPLTFHYLSISVSHVKFFTKYVQIEYMQRNGNWNEAIKCYERNLPQLSKRLSRCKLVLGKLRTH